MNCPKCGYKRQARDDAFVPATECPSCGIVYAKHDSGQIAQTADAKAANPPYIRPSPVDPESLKKARDRVEKRLRNRSATRIKNESYTQTLEMARKLSAEESDNSDLPIRRPPQAKSADMTITGDAGASCPIPEKQADDAQLLENKVAVPKPDDEKPKIKQATIAQAIDKKKRDEQMTPKASADMAPEATGSKAGKKADARHARKTEKPAVKPKPKEKPTVPDDDVKIETVLLSPVEKAIVDTSEETSLTDLPPTRHGLDPAPEDTEFPPAFVAAKSMATRSAGLGPGLMRLLPAVAWLILLAGVVGAVLSWTTLSDVEAGVRIPVSGHTDTLPLGLLLGFAYLATGALGFAFFWVASMIGRQLKDIRRLLLLHPISMMSDDLDHDRPDTL